MGASARYRGAVAATTGPSRAADGVPPFEPSWFERKAEGRPWLAPAAVGAFVGLATAYTAWQDPNGDGLFPGCPTQSVFGVDCPGCGGLRATHALVHGDIAQAFDHNVLAAAVLPLAALVWAVWMVRAVRATLALRSAPAPAAPGPRPRTFPLRLPGGSSPVWKAVMVLLVGFSVVRNIDAVPLFAYLHSDA